MIEQLLFDHVPAKAVPQSLAARAAAMAAVAPPPAAATPQQSTAPRPAVDEWKDVTAAADARFAAMASKPAPQPTPKAAR